MRLGSVKQKEEPLYDQYTSPDWIGFSLHSTVWNRSKYLHRDRSGTGPGRIQTDPKLDLQKAEGRSDPVQFLDRSHLEPGNAPSLGRYAVIKRR